MNKSILDSNEYSFDVIAGTVTFIDDYDITQILLITNVTTNNIIYNFACVGYGGALVNKVLTLQQDVSAMNNTDVLSIIIYKDISEGGTTTNSLLEEIRKSNIVLNHLGDLLIEQNIYLKEMF